MHVWAGMVIHMELFKKLKFDDSTKWYMHKQESALKNEMQRDHPILARRLVPVIKKKKKGEEKDKAKETLPYNRLCRSKENEKTLPFQRKRKDKYSDVKRELRKL